MEKIKVLVADDHPLMRDAICAAIEVEPDMQIVGQAKDGMEAIEQVRALQPDVTMMDLFMPDKNGLEAAKEILQENPRARILALTSSSDKEWVTEAIQIGMAGYLMKDIHREEMLQAIREVYRGNAYLPPSVARKLMDGMHQQAAAPAPALLTAREQEVLKLLGQGAANGEMAETLCISEATVRVHVHNIQEKLNLENRSQVIVYAARKA